MHKKKVLIKKYVFNGPKKILLVPPGVLFKVAIIIMRRIMMINDLSTSSDLNNKPWFISYIHRAASELSVAAGDREAS